MILSSPVAQHVLPSHRTANFTYAIRNLARAAEARARQGREVLYFNIGDPQAYGFRPPTHVTEAIERNLRDGFSGYAPSAGLAEAREAVAGYATNFGAQTSPDDVLITSGASEAADLILTALVNEADEVLVPAPGYPLYSAILGKLGARAIYYQLDETQNWQPCLTEIASLINTRTRAILLINPSNPTGAIIPDATVKRLLELAATHNLLVIADEVYRELCFQTPPVSASVLAARTNANVSLVTLESLSKTHLIPGWRVGWMRFTNSSNMTELIRAVRRLADGRLCSPTITQYAVRPALEGETDSIKDFVRTLKRRRDFTLEAINRTPGLSCVTPDAAFYTMINAAATTRAKTFLPQDYSFDNSSRGNSLVNNSTRDEAAAAAIDERFVLEMLNETGVLVVHGSGFGAKPESMNFRFIYLAAEPQLETVLKRIADFTTR